MPKLVASTWALLIYVLGALVLFVGCTNQKSTVLHELCGHIESNLVCPLPVAAVLAHRSSLYGALVRIEGILISGQTEEPPGVFHNRTLLYASQESAERCSTIEAIELHAATAELQKELEEQSGWAVTIVGRLSSSSTESWIELDVLKGPTVIHGQQRNYGCLKPAPLTPASGL